MTLDYKFLHEYVQHEIKRLSAARQVLVLHKGGYLNDRKLADIVPDERRDWQYGQRVKKNDLLIIEVNEKLSFIEPKIQKLIEQREILKTLI